MPTTARRSPQSLDLGRYQQERDLQMLQRLRYSSFLVLALAPFQLYADFFLYRDASPASFRYILLAIHVIGLLLSLLYLMLYPHKRMTGHRFGLSPSVVITAYSCLYLGGGILASLNSQSLTGNVDAYVVILFAVAVLLPYRPVPFLVIVAAGHALFLLLLAHVSRDPFALVSKQINTSAAALMSVVAVFTFDRLRFNNFRHRVMLEEKEEHLRRLFMINPLPLVLTSMDGERVILHNDKAKDWLGLYEEGREAPVSSLLYRDETDRLEIAAGLEQNGRIPNRMLPVTLPSGETRWVIVNYERMDYAGEACVLIGMTDISELKRLEDELTRHATTDELTGVLNRRQGMLLLQKEMEESERTRRGFVLGFVDINGLKQVNDRYGHAEGDDLIATASGVVQQHLRPGEFLFRFGGDEFVMVLRGGLKEAGQRWEHMQYGLLEANRTAGKPYETRASCGLTRSLPGSKLSPEELIERADAEMYQNKKRLKAPSSDKVREG
ncbi:sensor domain-containing diguanylate cyclase [Paenibacillus sp. CC-CFT747]|nr:sensor domain-containing diguanylate cyclase [Paenibacillus sp. CC-CFT747]